jgi:lipopolysaccharide biosynthesis protein wzxC
VQNEVELLRAGYRKAMRLLVQLSAPILTMLLVLAHPLYRVLFGEKWMEAAGFFQILCLAGLLSPLIDYNANVLMVKGRGDLFLRIDIVRRIIGVIAMVIALSFSRYWGVYGLLWSTVISQVIFLFINSYYSGRFINYTIWNQLSELLPFFLMSGVSGIAVWGVDTYLTSGLSDFLRLAIGGCTMGGVYLALLYTFARKDLFYVWALLQEHLLKRKV